MRVTDPSGVDWVVWREWFGVPIWARREPSLGLPSDIPGDGAFDDAWGLAALAVLVLAFVVLVIVLSFVLPLALLLAGIVVASVALLARLASVSKWTVRAESKQEALDWRVRGFVRSKRMMREIASALERGDEIASEGAVPAG